MTMESPKSRSAINRDLSPIIGGILSYCCSWFPCDRRGLPKAVKLAFEEPVVGLSRSFHGARLMIVVVYVGVCLKRRTDLKMAIE